MFAKLESKTKEEQSIMRDAYQILRDATKIEMKKVLLDQPEVDEDDQYTKLLICGEMEHKLDTVIDFLDRCGKYKPRYTEEAESD
jgi:hypothetical protein